MALTLDIRRTVTFGFALLLFLAVIGPSCLLQASEAMGMPMGSTSTTPGDCDPGTGGSMSACPHTDPIEITTGSAPTDTQTVDVALVAVASMPAAVTSPSVIPRAESYLSPPPSHLTPLRL